MEETQFQVLLLLQLLWVAPVEAPGPGSEVPEVWAQEGAPAQLPCSPTIPLQDLSRLRKAGVTWQHLPDSPGLAPRGAHPYTVLRLAPGGLRSGRPPLQSRVKLEERGLQRGDFSLWLRPARLADAGEYSATVNLKDGALTCRLRLRVGQASVTASPPRPLWTCDWVVLNCSFSRPDLPTSIHWFRGPSRVPVQESPHHHLVGSLLFLPQVSPLDSGPWGCILTYRDGFSVSSTYDLTVLGNSSSLPSHLDHNAFLLPLTSPTYGSPVQVFCRSGATSPSDSVRGSRFPGGAALPTAAWYEDPVFFPHCQVGPPGGGPDLLVAGKNGNFSLQLEAVSQGQAGTYTCHIHLQGQQLSTTVTLAVITVTPKSSGLPGKLRKLLCEVTPAFGLERFVWSPLDKRPGRSFPGPWLEVQEASLLAQPWQCHLYHGERLLGTATYFTELSGSGAQRAGRAPGGLKTGHLPLFLVLGVFLFLVNGAFGFHLWRKWRRPRRFSALEHGIHPPRAQSKIEDLEPEPEPGPEPEQDLEPEPEPDQGRQQP